MSDEYTKLSKEILVFLHLIKRPLALEEIHTYLSEPFVIVNMVLMKLIAQGEVKKDVNDGDIYISRGENKSIRVSSVCRGQRNAPKRGFHREFTSA